MPFWNKGTFRAKLENKMCTAKETPEPVFDISDCNMHTVPEGVFSMCKVFRKEVLLLQTNQLRSLHNGGLLSDLHLLKVLNLSSNKFHTLPDDLHCLCNLEVLHLENNYLKVLPKTFANLKSLRTLNIKGNSFRVFPMAICNLGGLRSLDISSNEKLKVLPKELSNLMCLENMELDVPNITYPPSDITALGAESIIKFLCKESNREYTPFLEPTVQDEPDYARRGSASSWNDSDFAATYQQYQRAKEQRHKELLQMEVAFKESNLLQAQLASDAFNKRKKLLEDVTQEQQKMDDEITHVQNRKRIEREQLLAVLANIEEDSAKLIEQLMCLNEKNKNVENMLEILELDRLETEELFSIKQEELEEMRKCDILDAMRTMLEVEERQREYEAEKLHLNKQLQESESETDHKLKNVLFDREVDRQVLIDKLIKEEYYQKEAFEALQLQRDKRHQEIVYQIRRIEKELSKLTLAEMKRQDLKADFEITVLAERRTALAHLLFDLLEAKELREEELKKRLVEMEEKRIDEIKDFWLLQYQKLMDRKPPEILDAEETMDPYVKQLLLDAGAANYLPLFAIKSITWKELLFMSFIDLKRIGMLDNAICEAVLSKREECVAAMEKYDTESRPQPSAPEVEPEFSGTAPPLSPDAEIKLFCQTECVICLDKESFAVFIPCGHVCCCWGCSQQVTLCPMCRNPVETRFTLTLP